MSLPWALYRLAAPALGALAPAARMFVSPRERALWSERMGHTALPGGCDAWVHAASLGEAIAARALVRELDALQPGARLLLTATTRGGRERLGALGHPAAIAPIDSPQAARRFFDGVRPARVILIETELWPHWLLRAQAAAIPVAVASARLSERSLARYRRLGGGLRALVAGLAAVLCQTSEDARRWRALGSTPDRTEVAGNLKDDALPGPVEDRAAARALLGLARARPLLVLGSVRPGEVALLAAAWRGLPAGLRERWQVVAVPRHPRASAELRAEAARAGQPTVSEGAPEGGAWRWEDRLGVLPAYYAAADVAFVGGSLGRYGGHNPLEPAACGAAVIIGPHHQAQAAGVRALVEHDAVVIAATTAEVGGALRALLGDEALRHARGAAARASADAQRGAARRTVARLAERDLWPAR